MSLLAVCDLCRLLQRGREKNEARDWGRWGKRQPARTEAAVEGQEIEVILCFLFTLFLPSFALKMSTSIPSFCFFLLLATAVRGNGEQNVILLLHLHPQYIPVSWLTPALLYAESLCSYFTSTVGSSRPYAYDGLDFKRVVLTIHITHWRPKQAHFSIKHWKLHVSTFLTDFVI